MRLALCFAAEKAAVSAAAQGPQEVVHGAGEMLRNHTLAAGSKLLDALGPKHGAQNLKLATVTAVKNATKLYVI